MYLLVFLTHPNPTPRPLLLSLNYCKRGVETPVGMAWSVLYAVIASGRQAIIAQESVTA